VKRREFVALLGGTATVWRSRRTHSNGDPGDRFLGSFGRRPPLISRRFGKASARSAMPRAALHRVSVCGKSAGSTGAAGHRADRAQGRVLAAVGGNNSHWSRSG